MMHKKPTQRVDLKFLLFVGSRLMRFIKAISPFISELKHGGDKQLVKTLDGTLQFIHNKKVVDNK